MERRAKRTGGRVHQIERVIAEYDAALLVGLKTLVLDSAIENADGDIELPKTAELLAAAVMARCLRPERLRGGEIKAIRKIMGLTLRELAEKLDPRSAQETISRWESEAQPMGGYAEKVLRLLVCEELKTGAPGIAYNGEMISKLTILDPWRDNPDYNFPPIIMRFERLKTLSGGIIETWGTQLAAS